MPRWSHQTLTCSQPFVFRNHLWKGSCFPVPVVVSSYQAKAETGQHTTAAGDLRHNDLIEHNSKILAPSPLPHASCISVITATPSVCVLTFHPPPSISQHRRRHSTSRSTGATPQRESRYVSLAFFDAVSREKEIFVAFFPQVLFMWRLICVSALGIHMSRRGNFV